MKAAKLRSYTTLAAAAIAFACGGGGDPPTSVQKGSLAVTISGVPAGASAAVSVTGPAFTRSIGATATLQNLAPGTYTVSAANISSGGATYAAQPASQSVDVAAGPSPATATVSYVAASGQLTVAVSGLPSGTAAKIEVDGPGSYTHSVTATETLTGLVSGTYTVVASSVSSGGSAYAPSPASKAFTIDANHSGSVTIAYAPSTGATNLYIDGLYLTQSVQTYDRAVPLVANKDGYLRVFVRADAANSLSPAVRVRIYNGSGTLRQTYTVGAPHSGVSTSAGDESALSNSWNVAVPGSLIQPGMRVLADVDPSNAIPEGNEGDNAFPASGTPLALDVRALTPIVITFVPVKQTALNITGNITSANEATFLTKTLAMHAVPPGPAITLHAPYSTSVKLESDGTGWVAVLSEIETIRTSEGRSDTYFGITGTNYNSGVAGVAYIGGKSGLGWDKGSSASYIVAHELGHTWNREHSPCGGAASPDPSYPYAGGATGVYGLEVSTLTAKPPTFTDIMGYCSNQWISDYTYEGVLSFRQSHPTTRLTSGAVHPALLVWGHDANGHLSLEPAFAVDTRAPSPSSGGSWVAEGFAADGGRVFALRFEPERVADVPGASSFALAVPLDSASMARVAELRVSGGGRVARLTTRATMSPSRLRTRATETTSLRALGAGRVALRWSAADFPMVMVRDPRTGEVLALARGGAAEVATPRAALELELSDGVRSVRRTVAVTR